MDELSRRPIATRVVAALYLILMLAGCVVAASGIVVAIQRYRTAVAMHGADWSWSSGGYVWSYSGTGVALLLLTLVFCFAFFRRPFRFVAPLAYILSYGICAGAFVGAVESAWKTDTGVSVFHALVVLSVIFILPALAASGGLLYWAARSRR